MIVGGSKKEVIKNIKKNAEENNLNLKVEINDPAFTPEESKQYLDKFFKIRENKLTFWLKSRSAYEFVDKISKNLDKAIEIEGLDNLKDINDGAIVTSNHFNPLENLAVRKVIKERYGKNIYVVSQETNLALPNGLGTLVSKLNIIPIAKSTDYIINTFEPYLKKVLEKKNYVLIYPEEEMWFNYRKPRPCKRGAYQYAAKFNKPIISCFVEIIDLDQKDNDEFNEVKYVVHVLKPIYPDANKTVKQNSKDMAETDYNQKKECYEKVYHKKLTYDFSYDDIAGLKKEVMK